MASRKASLRGQLRGAGDQAIRVGPPPAQPSGAAYLGELSEPCRLKLPSLIRPPCRPDGGADIIRVLQADRTPFNPLCSRSSHPVQSTGMHGLYQCVSPSRDRLSSVPTQLRKTNLPIRLVTPFRQLPNCRHFPFGTPSPFSPTPSSRSTRKGDPSPTSISPRGLDPPIDRRRGPVMQRFLQAHVNVAGDPVGQVSPADAWPTSVGDAHPTPSDR